MLQGSENCFCRKDAFCCNLGKIPWKLAWPIRADLANQRSSSLCSSGIGGGELMPLINIIGRCKNTNNDALTQQGFICVLPEKLIHESFLFLHLSGI